MEMDERKPTRPVRFVGWIYGDQEDESTLRELGVEGEMSWKISGNEEAVYRFQRQKNGIFEHCTITMEVAKRLRDNYPAFSPQSFTGLDWDGNQTIHQPLWKGEYED